MASFTRLFHDLFGHADAESGVGVDNTDLSFMFYLGVTAFIIIATIFCGVITPR